MTSALPTPLRSRIAAASLAGLTAIALAAPALLPARAEAAKKLIKGRPKVAEAKVVRPSRGPERGGLVLWARVRHAALSKAVLNRLHAGATHRARVTFRITPRRGGRSVKRTVRLGLRRTGERVQSGATATVNPKLTRALAAASGRLRVRTVVKQTLDADGDGDADARARTVNVRVVKPRRVKRVVAPTDGIYTGLIGSPGGKPLNLFFGVRQGSVKLAGFLGGEGCNAAFSVGAPIDPSDGSFRFKDEVTTQVPPVFTNQALIFANGSFAGSGSRATVNTGGWRQTNCGEGFLNGIVLNRQ